MDFGTGIITKAVLEFSYSLTWSPLTVTMILQMLTCTSHGHESAIVSILMLKSRTINLLTRKVQMLTAP